MADPSRPSRDRSWIKRAPRVDGEHQALAVDGDGRQYSITILDLSKGGFKIRSDETFRIGEYIAIRVPQHGDFSAQIRWALGDEAGGIFLNPVDLPDG